ncbi:hypothetical protein [Tunicatimonas pelagia]|uniref:hypothetical protein n=1 Tax=Tunicatimonas pelagia TaxID=931531 RepID=UPI00266512D1|nr:hypothetical protein [Tunicatimonas pelagia]WKN45162.1 hypothetical protein P0M28_09330 [Tunicatimonas pelagia]
MKKQLQFPLRISSRHLLTFKIFACAGVALIVLAVTWLFLTDPPENLLDAITFIGGWIPLIVILILALVRFKRYRNVIWNDDHLLVKDKYDIIIPLSEVRKVELKTLNGVHQVHLLEEHPYLGDSFYFLGSLNYFFRHKKIDLTTQALNERIAQAKQEAA